MAEYVSIEQLEEYPIRLDHYDKEHGNRHFVFGIESIIEYAKYYAKDLQIVREDNKLEYKGFTAHVYFDAKGKVLYGKIENSNDLVTFESESALEIEKEFHDTVDDYIEFCEKLQKEAEENA